jgi:hypothetical protein
LATESGGSVRYALDDIEAEARKAQGSLRRASASNPYTSEVNAEYSGITKASLSER